MAGQQVLAGIETTHVQGKLSVLGGFHEALTSGPAILHYLGNRLKRTKERMTERSLQKSLRS